MSDLKLTQHDPHPRNDPRSRGDHPHASGYRDEAGGAEAPREVEGREDVCLCPADGEALEVVLTARRLGLPEDMRLATDGDERVGRMQVLLGALDAASGGEVAGGEAADEALVTATLAKVAARREAEAAARVAVTPLVAEDAAALDALMANGMRPGPMPAELTERAERVRAVLSLLGGLPAEARASESDDEALVRRTLEAAAEQRQRERFDRQVAMFAEPARTAGVGWRQVLTAAAVFFLGFSLLMPMLEHNRQQARQIGCATNLAIAGQQMGAYAADFGGVLPRGPVGDSWIKAGQPDAVDAAGRYQSNSAHLYLLIREGYVAPRRLACESNAEAGIAPMAAGQVDWRSAGAISYSYQNQHAPKAIRINRARPSLAVLADKNPLFVVRDGRVVYDARAQRDAPSALHGRAGQNVLMLDGRVMWSSSPWIDGDNVWQITGHAGPYAGHETPLDALRDSFLVP